MQNKKEIWKDIEGYEGLYQVSSFGRIKSFVRKNEIILSGSVDNNNYSILDVTLNGKRKVKSFHRLVAEAFLGKSDLFVNHKDRNPTNNNIENLEYVTHRDNVIHGIKAKKTYSKYTGVSWSKKNSKWTAQIRLNKKLKYLGSFNNEIDAYNTYLKAAEENGIKSKYA